MGFSEKFLEDVLQEWFNQNTIKLAILAPSHTIDEANQSFFSDISANQISDPGYSDGGQAVDSISVSLSGGEAFLDFDDEVFPLTGPEDSQYAALYRDTGDPATSVIVDQRDFGQETTENGDLTISPATDGWFKLSVASS